jgi:hypothetical protein
LKEHPQRCLVQRIARQHVVSYGKAFGCYNKGYYHLPAIGAFVPAVAEFCLGILLTEAFKIGAGKIIKQYVKFNTEHILPSGFKIYAKFLFMLQYPVETTIQPVLGGDSIIGIEQFVHGALIKPLPVNIEFTGWFDKAIYCQQLEHL